MRSETEPVATSAVGIEPEDLFRVAEKFAEQGRYEEAVELCESGVRLFPGSLAMKIGLGKMRNLLKEREEQERRRLMGKFQEERARQDAHSLRFVALGEVYEKRGQEQKAFECYHLALVHNPSNELARLALARLFYRGNDFPAAVKELKALLASNPFHAEALALLGRAQFYLKNYKAALASILDAMILDSAAGRSPAPELQEKFKYLQDRLKIQSRTMRSELVKRRLARFSQHMSQLDLQKDALLGQGLVKGLHDVGHGKETSKVRQDLLSLALRLRAFELLAPLSDENLFVVAKAVREMEVSAGKMVFDEADEGDDLFLVERGDVRLVKNTPFGEQMLSVAQKGEIFGEMNFIDPAHRSADAVAEKDCTLFALRRCDLDPFFELHKDVAVQFYWTFWKSLSRRTREANNLLRTFFAEADQAPKAALSPEHATRSKAISIELDRKIKLLQEQGLSAKELRLLAAFSTEELYNLNEVIFREGSQGDKLYIILDGRVRITKHIPGVGEEALAILGKGDFFGEMALVDNEPRSADARAHENGTTVLTISRAVLNEILSVDVESAQQFLYILCRILTQRLREINLKIIQWRLMAGGF